PKTHRTQHQLKERHLTMATTLSLDSSREAADKKYAGLEVDLGDGDIVVLKNPLRVSKEARERLEGLSAAEGEDSDPLEYFGEIYEALAGKEGAEKLLKAQIGSAHV